MRPATRRALSAASVLALLTVAGCSDDADKKGNTDTKAAGCDGAAAPAYSGEPVGFDSPVRIEQGRAVAVEAGAPKLTKTGSGSPGWAVAQVAVDASVATNGIFAISPDSFMLVDQRGHQCSRPRTSPASELKLSQINESRPAKGTVDFLVPEGADLSTYSVRYAADPAGKTAEAAWSKSGDVVDPAEFKGCSSTPSPMRTEVGRKPFDTVTGVRVAGLSAALMNATKPVPVNLPPGADHPNDVMGLRSYVSVKAVGQPVFLDRGMFQLTDGQNNLCTFGKLGTTGENLNSVLIQTGQTRTFTIIFWAPKGSKPTGLQLFYRSDLNDNVGAAVWYDPKENPPYPKPKPSASSSSAPASSAPGASGSSSSAAPSSSATSSAG